MADTKRGLLSPANHWLLWTVPTVSTALLLIIVITDMVAANVLADNGYKHVTPYRWSLIITLYAIACVILIAWHYIGGRAAGTPARRAALWDHHKSKWYCNPTTGTWSRILRKTIDGSLVLSKVTRFERLEAERSVFWKRIRTAFIVHPVGIAAIVSGNLLLIQAAPASSSEAVTYGLNWYVAHTVFAVGIVAELLLLCSEVIYQSGTEIGRKATSDKLLRAGHRGTGAMVIDPAQPMPRTAETFGPKSTTQPTDQMGPADLSYKPNT